MSDKENLVLLPSANAPDSDIVDLLDGLLTAALDGLLVGIVVVGLRRDGKVVTAFQAENRLEALGGLELVREHLTRSMVDKT